MKEEELDRKLVMDMEKSDGSIYAVIKAVVGRKDLMFETVHHEVLTGTGTYSQSKYIHKARITFQKLNGAKYDGVEIEVHNFLKNNRPRRCDLGHYHHDQPEEYEWTEWQRFKLGWEQMEQLIEWFQTGRFYDARTRQAKQRVEKNGFHSKEKL